MKQIFFTQEGYNSFVREVQDLEEKRKLTIKDLQQAREMGDLSENGFYKATKSRLSDIDHRISFLDSLLKYARIMEKKVGEVSIGNTVHIDMDGKEQEYTIVGDYEADSLKHKISLKSPLGKALFTKKAGERFVFPVGTKEQTGKILSIE